MTVTFNYRTNGEFGLLFRLAMDSISVTGRAGLL